MRRYEEKDIQLLFHAVDNLMEECLARQQEAEHFWMDSEKYVVLLTFSAERSEQRIGEQIWELTRQIFYSFENFLNIRLSIALSCHTGDISTLNMSYEELLMLKDQRFFYPEKNFFSYREFYKRGEEESLYQSLKN